jgi:hypothetical protein
VDDVNSMIDLYMSVIGDIPVDTQPLLLELIDALKESYGEFVVPFYQNSLEKFNYSSSRNNDDQYK